MKTSIRLTFSLAAILLTLISGMAQPAERRISRSQYIETWKDQAILQMQLHGIPASITLAQGILESADGNSALAKYANNHFGIKCHDWEGETYIQDDDTYNECFRKYDEASQSYNDHSQFLLTRSRYSFLFNYKSNDYENWAHGLKKAGYATNPQYGNLLIQIIEDHDLSQYDKMNSVSSKEVVSEVKVVATLTKVKHEVEVHDNNIKYIEVKHGDTFQKIADEFEMGLWQIYKYNDLNKSDVLQEGDIIYLQPKRNSAKVDLYTVKKGDSMKKISQLYGVKLKKIYKKNNMEPGTEPEVGQVLWLRGKKEI